MPEVNDRAELPNQTPNSEEIKLAFALSKKDILWYNLHFNRGVIYLGILFSLLFFPGLLLALQHPAGDLGTFYLWLEIGICLGWVLCFSSILAIVLQVFYLKSPVVEKAMEYRHYVINSAGVAVFTSDSRLVRTWREIIKIIRTKHRFYLRTSDKAAIIIPGQVLKDAEGIENLKRILKNAELNKRNS